MKSRFPASLRVIGRSVVDWWDGWLDFVLVSIVWLFAQLTIILGPPATFGAYYVVSEMRNGEALGVRGLISGARKYFWKALLWGLINLAVIATIVVNFQFYGSIDALWAPYIRAFVVMLALVWFSTQFYTLPFFMEQEEKRLLVAMRNGLFTTLAAPLYSIILLIVVIIVAVASFGLVLPVFLGLPGLIPVMGMQALNDRLIAFGLRKAEKTPKEIEFEQSGHIDVPVLDRLTGNNPDSVPDGEITQSEGQIKQDE